MPRIDQIMEMLKAEPGDLFLNYALAIELYKTDQKENAIQQLLNLINTNPGYLPSYYQLGSWYKEAGHFNQAREIIYKGIDLALHQKNHKTLRELKEMINQIDFENE